MPTDVKNNIPGRVDRVIRCLIVALMAAFVAATATWAAESDSFSNPAIEARR